MGFWEEHAEAEAKAAPPAPPSLQDAPGQCAYCPHFGADVLIGVCEGCA